MNVALLAQVTSQDSQLSWQPNLTPTSPQYSAIRSALFLKFLVNHVQVRSGFPSTSVRLNVNVASSSQVCATTSAGMRAMMMALEKIIVKMQVV